MFETDRRSLLAHAAALLGAAALPAASRAQGADAPAFGPATPFSYDALSAEAKAAAEAPYAPFQLSQPQLFDAIDFDAHWRIRWRDEMSMEPAGGDAPVQLFHPGRYFPQPVRIHLVEGGEAREVEFSRDLFEMPSDSPARKIPLEDMGFAGFRVMRPGLKPDWISFLGASYFRTDGPFGQYGLSARGLAVNTGLSQPEEFPRFSAFWIGAGEREDETLTVWAMMESPSLAGAYRIGMAPGQGKEGPLTRVEARIYMREGVERIGFAPLTSMFWYDERNRITANDWRPEVHDSDGLSIETGSGERIWRPLNNPDGVRTSSFSDTNPRGFGLIQRDRSFDNYQDDGVFYDKRPSAWVTPIGDWGRGAVQLVEIPTGDETFDNIVAYWTPEVQPQKGDMLDLSYELRWRDQDPRAGDQARAVAVRQGHGGIPGQPLPPGVDKMVIDFEGPALKGAKLEEMKPVVEAGGAVIESEVALRPVVGTTRWRLSFDYRITGSGPAEMRIHLRRAGGVVSETVQVQAGYDRRG